MPVHANGAITVDKALRAGGADSWASQPVGSSQRLYQELFDFAPEAHLLTDSAGIISDANHATAELFGTRWEFLRDKPLACFVAHADWLAFYDWLGQLRAGLTPAFADWRLHVQPVRGEPCEMIAQVARLRSEQGPARALHWQLRPVSAREEIERNLRHERHFSDSVLEIAQTLILVVDAHGSVVRANQALCAALGCAADELAGQPWWTFVPPAERSGLQRLLRGTLQLSTMQRVIGNLLPKDRPPRTIVWGLKGLAAEPTAPATILAVGHDITELQQAQRQALQTARLAAIGQVTTALAHEARNMLQRIQGGLERLSWRLEDRPEALEILASVRNAQRDLTYLFDDVRSYAAPIKLEFGLCRLTEVWLEAWQQALAAAPGKAARLTESNCDTAPITCWADRFRLVQVFRNIFENAVTAGPEHAEVRVTCRDTYVGDVPALAIAVRDNGPGLNAEQRQKIFEPFYTTKPRGTGLGMAIAKRLVEAHGGRIGIGEASAGAEIVVTLLRSPSR